MQQLHNTSCVEWTVESDSLCIRFSRVPQCEFHELLTEFQREITNGFWDAETRFWRIPLDNIQAVARFADRKFGHNAMVYVGTDPIPIQLELPL